MGKIKKRFANKNLMKDVHHHPQQGNCHGVKHENQFKHCNTSTKNFKKKCQKLQVKKLFEKCPAIDTEDLSVSMNGLNISVVDDLDTDKDKGLCIDSFIVLDESISSTQQITDVSFIVLDDSISTTENIKESVIVLDDSISVIQQNKENKKSELIASTGMNYIVLDETFEENREVTSAPKKNTKSIFKAVPKMVVSVSNKDQEVMSKENVKPPQLSNKLNNIDVKQNKLNKDKYNRMVPLADATNNQRTKVFSNNSLFSEITKTTRGCNDRSNGIDFDGMLNEYKSLRKVDKCTTVVSKSHKTKSSKRKDEELHNLNISCLENMKASLENEIHTDILQKTRTIRRSYVPEPDMNESMERYGNNYYMPKKTIKTKLRPIYIDGSNVAFGHTQGKYFSVTGLKICIDYFLKRGHQVHAFVPHFRKNKCSNPVLFEQLIKNGLIITTPSRYLNGRNLTPYDDRYIVKCAAVNKGIIVSCDNYRDLIQENPSLEPVIEERLLMPMWVQDMLIFPDDPLGRNGPSLEAFLRF